MFSSSALRNNTVLLIIFPGRALILRCASNRYTCANNTPGRLHRCPRGLSGAACATLWRPTTPTRPRFVFRAPPLSKTAIVATSAEVCSCLVAYIVCQSRLKGVGPLNNKRMLQAALRGHLIKHIRLGFRTLIMPSWGLYIFRNSYGFWFIDIGNTQYAMAVVCCRRLSPWRLTPVVPSSNHR